MDTLLPLSQTSMSCGGNVCGLVRGLINFKLVEVVEIGERIECI